MKNITLSVDERVLAAVRRVAADNGTTVNAIVREHLNRLAEYADRAAKARRRIRELSEASKARIGSSEWHRTICMSVDSFLDTNVLVYAVASDPVETHKRASALALIEREAFALSAQVLQEFYVTVTRKLETPLSSPQAMEWIEQWEAFPCMPIDAALVKIAAEISERYRISYWDGAVIAAAELAGAAIVYSEDLNDGQRYSNVAVTNPFRISGLVQDQG